MTGNFFVSYTIKIVDSVEIAYDSIIYEQTADVTGEVMLESIKQVIMNKHGLSAEQHRISLISLNRL